jgi:hypothetical protein
MKRGGQVLHVDWNATMKAVSESRDGLIARSGFKLPQI